MFTRNLRNYFSYKVRKYLKRNGCNILTYHSIVHEESLPFTVWTQLDAKLFEDHLCYLSNNYNCVSLNEFLRQMSAGRLIPNSVVITFDDGYANNYHAAFPLLKKYSLHATIFVVAGLIETNTYIWSDKIAMALLVTNEKSFNVGGILYAINSSSEKASAYRVIVNYLKSVSFSKHDQIIESIFAQLNVNDIELQDADYHEYFRILRFCEIDSMVKSKLIDIGSHTYSHPILSKVEDDIAYREIMDAKNIFENNVKNVTSFAYPNGSKCDYSEVHKNIVVDAGYKSILTTSYGAAYISSDIFDLPRKCIGQNTSVSDLKYLLSN